MRSNWLVRSIVAMAILAQGAVGLQAGPTMVVDQANSGPATGTNGGSTFGQSFTPTLPGIDYIEILLAGQRNTVTVEILDGVVGNSGLGGDVIGMSNPTLVHTTNTGSHQMIRFDFATTVNLIPGNTYVAKLVSDQDVMGISHTGDSYSGGQFLAQGFSTTSYTQDRDLVFEEGMLVDPIPAPGALALTGIGFGLVNWLRRRRGL